MSIKAGVVAVMKTTEEPVFVLRLEGTDKIGDPLAPELQQTVAVVRRPVFSETGTRYDIGRFFVDELETSEARQMRHYREMSDLRAQLQAEQKVEGKGEQFGNFN